jgi:HK97 family phage major capsid protein
MATVEELQARLGEIKSRLTEIDKEHREGGIEELPNDERAEWNDLNEERETLETTLSEAEARRQVVESLSENENAREETFQAPKQRARGHEIWDLSTVRSSVSSPDEAKREMTDRAKYAIEQSSFPHERANQEDVQGHLERLLSKDDEHGTIAKRFLQTGSPSYERAFAKAVAGREITNEERTALSTVDAQGGFAVPFTLDPTVIPTSNLSVNPFRAISRVETITTTTWQGVTSAGVTGTYGYTTEAAEATDNSPVLAQPTLDPVRAQVFIPFSIEISQDWAGLQSEMARLIQDAKDDLEATKFAVGSGSNEPSGVLQCGTPGTTAGTAALAAADLYTTEASLPPRWRPRASWVANRAVYNKVRQIDTSGGAQLWTENLQRGLANQVPTPGNTGYNLLGYPANEASSFASTLATGGTIAVLGDFSQYLIVDRVGMSIEVIPHLFGATANYPTGQRGLFAFWRNSGTCLVSSAFLKLKTL